MESIISTIKLTKARLAPNTSPWKRQTPPGGPVQAQRAHSLSPQPLGGQPQLTPTDCLWGHEATEWRETPPFLGWKGEDHQKTRVKNISEFMFEHSRQETPGVISLELRGFVLLNAQSLKRFVLFFQCHELEDQIVKLFCKKKQNPKRKQKTELSELSLCVSSSGCCWLCTTWYGCRCKSSSRRMRISSSLWVWSPPSIGPKFFQMRGLASCDEFHGFTCIVKEIFAKRAGQSAPCSARTFDMPTSFLVGYADQDKGLGICMGMDVFGCWTGTHMSHYCAIWTDFMTCETLSWQNAWHLSMETARFRSLQLAGIIEMRVRKIAWNYLRSWFMLDLTIVAIVRTPAQVSSAQHSQHGQRRWPTNQFIKQPNPTKQPTKPPISQLSTQANQANQQLTCSHPHQKHNLQTPDSSQLSKNIHALLLGYGHPLKRWSRRWPLWSWGLDAELVGMDFWEPRRPGHQFLPHRQGHCWSELMGVGKVDALGDELGWGKKNEDVLNPFYLIVSEGLLVFFPYLSRFLNLYFADTPMQQRAGSSIPSTFAAPAAAESSWTVQGIFKGSAWARRVNSKVEPERWAKKSSEIAEPKFLAGRLNELLEHVQSECFACELSAFLHEQTGLLGWKLLLTFRGFRSSSLESWNWHLA